MLLEKLKYQQWKNNDAVIKWPKGVKNKENSKFIKDFYSSITEETLDAAIAFAQTNTNVSNNDIRIIKHSRNSFLFTISKHGKRKQNLTLMLL